MIYLVVSAVGRFLTGGGKKGKSDDGTDVRGSTDKKGFPRDMGEYVDYEELDDDDED
ncbi:MAG: hypothetical protein R6V34_02850 [Bacteroidales bacterium]